MEKPAMNQFFDQYIKEALKTKAEEIQPSDILLNRINVQIKQKEKENHSMKQFLTIKRVKPLIIVSLVLILSAATCFAASQISSLRTMSTNVINEFPTTNQVKNIVNYIPDYVEEFSNGFHFERASVDQTEAMDNDDNKVGECKGITFYYTNEHSQKEQILSLSTDSEIFGMAEDIGSNEEVISNGDMDLIYSQVTFKVVPEGYVPTEEEKKKMDQEILWISYGSDEIEVSDIQYIRWTRDGIIYNLMEKGYQLEKDEMIEMAREVIGTAE